LFDDADKINKQAGSIIHIKDAAKRLFLSGTAIALISFMSLSVPSTIIRLGEMSNVLYNLVIEYSETRSTQSDLAKMSSVQAGILYQIDVNEGNKTTVYNFRSIDRNVEIYDVATPLSPQKLPNSVRSILSAEPDLVQLTYQATDSQLIFTLDQTAIRDVVRGYMPMIFAALITLLSSLSIILYFVIRRFYVAPLEGLTSTLTEFAADATIPRPVSNALKINKDFRDTAKALDKLQRNTISEMRQRERLADIGEAVAKINHDIRNVLSSATLVADALLNSDDARVNRSAPHVVRSL
jgi:signal transduction histidine kinase